MRFDGINPTGNQVTTNYNTHTQTDSTGVNQTNNKAIFTIETKDPDINEAVKGLKKNQKDLQELNNQVKTTNTIKTYLNNIKNLEELYNEAKAKGDEEQADKYEKQIQMYKKQLTDIESKYLEEQNRKETIEDLKKEEQKFKPEYGLE